MIFSNVRKELPGAQRLRGQNHSTHRPISIEINQITPETLIEKASRYGNFSDPMHSVSKASVPSVRCSRSVLSPQATKAASR